MKKRMLFVIPDLSAGGGEKSLVNLLSQINYEQYEVDLFLFHHGGLFMEFVPKEVRVLSLPETYQCFAKPMLSAIARLMVKGHWSLMYHRMMFAWKSRMIRNASIREQMAWPHMAAALSPVAEPYDVAIGFLEKTSTYFCVDKVQACHKWGWVHIDYDELGMDPRIDIAYFQQLDVIVTVSEECAKVLQNRFPTERDKVKVFYNIVSPDLIRSMANQGLSDVWDGDEEHIHIVTIGRLHHQKGLELAIDACRLLVDQGFPVRWHVIGEGEERHRLTQRIAAKKLEEHFILHGLKSNPYPYIQQAMIYAQTSRFEGKSIAIDEAKILHKPILVTDYSTAKDQIRDGIDGLIVPMHPEGIAEGIRRLIQDESLRKRLSHTLARLRLGTEDEIHKLDQWVSER